MIEKILERLEALTHDNPMVTDNYILRKEAIEIVQEVAKEYGKDTNVRSNGWIPHSERLPEDDSDVLVEFEDGGHDVAWYDNFGWDSFYMQECPHKPKVVAWMPIVPYQKGE